MAARQQAFATAYREHLNWMLHTVRRLGVSAAEHEDVVHDVFSTAWLRLADYDSTRPIRPWLFGIAFRIVSNRKVTKSSNEVLEADLDMRMGAVDKPDELLQREATRQHVLKALEALPLEQRALFVGHDIEATPVIELARELEVPLNTAYSRLRLARQRFESVFSALQNGVPA